MSDPHVPRPSRAGPTRSRARTRKALQMLWNARLEVAEAIEDDSASEYEALVEQRVPYATVVAEAEGHRDITLGARTGAGPLVAATDYEHPMVSGYGDRVPWAGQHCPQMRADPTGRRVHWALLLRLRRGLSAEPRRRGLAVVMASTLVLTKTLRIVAATDVGDANRELLADHVDQMLARVFARLEEKLDDLGLDLVVGDSRQEEP